MRAASLGIRSSWHRAVLLVAVAALLCGAFAVTSFGSAKPVLSTTCGALKCATFSVGLTGNGTGELAVVTSTGSINHTIECKRGGGITSGVCSFSYPAGITIYWAIGASSGSKTTCSSRTFVCDTSTSIRHFTLSADTTLTGYGFALLDPVTVTVSVTGSGTGTVTSTPSGISCGEGKTTCSVAFAAGSNVKLTAAAASGSTLTVWTGGCSGANNTCSFSPASGTSVSVGAQFDLLVTATPSPRPTATHAPTPAPTGHPTTTPKPGSTPGSTTPGATTPGSTTPGATSLAPTTAPATSSQPGASGAPSAETSPDATTAGVGDESLPPIATPNDAGSQPASSSGSGGLPLVPILGVLMVVLIAGAFIAQRRRSV